MIAFAAVFVYNSGMKIDLTALRGKRVCVAVSGGGDSVALLHCLAAQAAEEDIVLSAVNVEHGIRGESSRADTEFVRALCARLGLPLYCFSVDVPALARTAGEGVEEAARKARYRIFLDLLRRDKADVIATAHHAGDNAESVLFQPLPRGVAHRGGGHPLLCAGRKPGISFSFRRKRSCACRQGDRAARCSG